MQSKEERRAYFKLYYQRNKNVIVERAKAYENDPQKKKLRQAYRKNYHEEHKDKHNQQQRIRVKQRNELRERIVLHYGCRNPNCSWKGPFKSCQLDLHHYNTEEKEDEFSQMRTASLIRYIAEVNKCIVLCRNCHQLFHSEPFPLDATLKCRVDPITLIIDPV